MDIGQTTQCQKCEVWYVFGIEHNCRVPDSIYYPNQPITDKIVVNHWDPLHLYEYTTPEECEKHYRKWEAAIPSINCTCRENWRNLVAKYPPDFSSAKVYFEWGVNRHNDVNLELLKPNFSIEKAYEKYWPKWNFVTVDRLASDTIKFIPKLPQNINRVVGMHRSGTVPAVLIATALNVPCDTWSMNSGLIQCGAGSRGPFLKEHYSDGVTLLVDDTVFSGRSLATAKKDIPNVVTAAIYAKPGSENLVDFYHEILPKPHILEWNVFQGWYTQGCDYMPGGIAFDFDGVLCADPPRIFNEDDPDDRPVYLEWIANAPVLNPVRTAEIPLVVSYRCEYTREATQAWLDKHSIRVKRLELWQGEPTSRTWQAADWKGKLYKESECSLFVESSSCQANDIFQFTGKRVLDLETKKILQRTFANA